MLFRSNTGAQANGAGKPLTIVGDGTQTRTGAQIFILPASEVPSGRFYSVIRANFGAEPLTTQQYLNWFAQDTWQINNNLTLKLGVRWERQTLNGGVPICFDDEERVGDGGSGNGNPINCEYTWSNNWSPRLGAIYDITGSGKSKLYANWGRFYVKIPNDLAARALSADAGVSRADYFDAGLTQPIPEGVSVGGRERHLIIAGLHPALFENDTTSTFTDEFLVGFEFEAMPMLNLGVRYIYRNLSTVLEDYAQASPVMYDAGFPGLGSVEYIIDNITADLVTLDPSGTPSFLAPMFWDGRATGLEQQALAPISSRVEMRGDAFPGSESEARAVALDSILERIRNIPEYVTQFREAFAFEGADTAQTVVIGSRLARALAAYERELVTTNSAYDRFVVGDDDALNPAQRRGLEIFFTKGKCTLCHRGAMFSNFLFRVTASPQEGPGKTVIPGDDTGREEHTGRPEDRYAFRVPSLRNVELTAPYMHAGVFETLDEVVDFYNSGVQPRNPSVPEDLIEVSVRSPLGLTASEISDVIQFLRSLTDPGSQLDAILLTVPSSVPSGLPPLTGAGTNVPGNR